MDWSKAKNILIFVFLLLNIFLFVMINKFYFGNSISKDTINNTIIALKNRNIIVKCDIPRYNNEIGTLSYIRKDYNKSAITNKFLGKDNIKQEKIANNTKYIKGYKVLTFLDENLLIYEDNRPQEDIDITQNSSVDNYIKDFLSGIDLPILRFRIDTIQKNFDGSLSVVLYEKYKGFLIFDNYIKADITKKGISYLAVKYREIGGMASKRKITPAYQVLLKNFKNVDSTVISHIDIGFKEHVLEYGTKELDDIPVWRIKSNGGIVKYFKAYNGEKLQ